MDLGRGALLIGIDTGYARTQGFTTGEVAPVIRSCLSGVGPTLCRHPSLGGDYSSPKTSRMRIKKTMNASWLSNRKCPTLRHLPLESTQAIPTPIVFLGLSPDPEGAESG
jgi:hypothetical protein